MTSLKRQIWVLVFLGVLLFSSCQEESQSFYPHKRLLKLGDNMDWANPELDDSNWNKRGSTFEVGRFWVRFHIDFDNRIEALNYKGIHLISLGSYQAFWDGVLIYESGKVGTDHATETPGRFISQILIPDSLSQEGSHVLALRLSNYHHLPNTSGSWNAFKVEEFYQSAKKELRLTAIMFILGGCFLLVALYYLMLYVKEKRDLSTLIFSSMCFLIFSLTVFEYLKFYWSYPYSFHATRMVVIGSLTAMLAFVVPLFLCLHLDIPRKQGFIVAMLMIVVLISLFYKIRFDTTAQLLSRVMLYSSILLSALAVWLKRKGGVLILSAFLTIVIINYFSASDFDFMIYSYDINLFLSFLILVLTILYSLSQHRKEQQAAYEQSLLVSERLKNELLRKNIRPHFMMNTLTSVMEWIEKSPQKSIEFITALADEFDLLNDVADQRMIPIQQEINLCKKHLEIMSFRKDVQYEWEDKDIDLNRKIPPAIFHTVVENGITHSKPLDDGTIKFKLTQTTSSVVIIYCLEVVAKNRKTQSPNTTGTGFKYIQSRLTESFGRDWSLTSAKTTSGWKTTISIPND